MKTPKKLLSSLLALALTVYTMPTVWAEDLTQLQDTPENSYSDSLITDISQTGDEVSNEADQPQNDDETITEDVDEEHGIAAYSLLPIEVVEGEVLIDFNSQRFESGVIIYYTCTVKDILQSILAENGKLDGSLNYNGNIVYSINRGYEDNYFPIGWNDYIEPGFLYVDFHPEYGWIWTEKLSFILSDDQLNGESVRYDMDVHFSKINSLISFVPYDKAGNPIRVVNKYYQGTNPFQQAAYAYVVSTENLETENGFEIAGFLLDIPEKYRGKLKVYTGDLENYTIYEDITSQVINDGTAKEPYSLDDYMGANLIFEIPLENGNIFRSGDRYEVKPEQNFVNLHTYYNNNSSYEYDYFYDENSIFTYTDIYKTNSLDSAAVSVSGVYYDFIDENSDGYGYYNASKIDFACFGKYDSKEAAVNAGKTNIKDRLFSYSGVPVDLSECENKTVQLIYAKKTVTAKKVTVTTIDKYGKIYINSVYFALDNTVDSGASDSTYFNIYGVKKSDDSGNKTYLSDYMVSSSNDGYVENGYKTLFILDNGNPVADGTVIYPVFSKGFGVNIYADGYNGVQTSGESPVTFESGKAIQYSAAAQNGTHLKNYWVTFVTQQRGAKLFVNAVNDPSHFSANGKPEREVFLTYGNGYKHDIFFANIGDAELNGINVSLSADAQGVKLDDYWTVIDSSVKKLAPFTKTSDLDNIAKLRLVPIDKEKFSIISGTLTISTSNGGSVDIELTGVAGVPKITTDTLYDGVKYVPYSSIIMTNSMHGGDSMSFSITDGQLPDGLVLRPNGEIYGIPTIAGEYTFTVKAVYTGAVQEDGSEYSGTRTYTIVIADNTDENVDATNEDEQGHPLVRRVSKYITVYYNSENNGIPVVDRIEIDSDLFWSEGALGELQDFYIDGVKLTEGSDYTAEEGSTKITVRAQTFGHIGMTDSEVPHTLAAEFRNADNNELKRSAQNVYLDYINTGSGNNGQGSGNDGQGGSNNSQGGNSNNTGTNSNKISNSDNNSGSVSAIMRIVDTNGDIVSGLSLELHSKPKYASTDNSGSVKFDSVEFGRHTLYIKDASNNKKISKTFSISSGQSIGMTGNVITASPGDTVHMTIEYDGSKIKILSVAEDVSSSAGAYSDGKMLLMDISQNVLSKRTLYVAILLLLSAITALAIRKKIKS